MISLPYPDMDFVPLDILTASEMDKMSANDNFLMAEVNNSNDAIGGLSTSYPADKVIMPSVSNGGASLGVIKSRPLTSFAYGASARLFRIGSIVYFFGAGAFNAGTLPTTYATISNIIPYGYRPVYTARASATRTASSANVGRMGIMEFTAGDTATTTPSNIRICFETNDITDNNFTATWITTDPITPIVGDENIELK